MARYSTLRQARTPQANYSDEQYMLSGLNMVVPDQLNTSGESPYTINSRMFAREAGEKRVAIRTRKGPGFYTIPIGETLDQSNITTNTPSTISFNQTNWAAIPFTAGASGPLTMLSLNIAQGTGTGTTIAEVWSNSGSNLPNALIARSGAAGSQVTSGAQYVQYRFINPAIVTSGTTYWIIIYAQDDNTGLFTWSTTHTGSGIITSNNSGGTWTSVPVSANFKTYVSSTGAIKGWYRAYYSNGSKVTYIAHGTTLYRVNDTDGTTTVVKSGLNSQATRYRFDKMNDKVIVVNGYDQPFEVDSSYTVTTLSNVPFIPSLVRVHKNRVWFNQVNDPSRVFFSDLADETSYPSVNFIYFPAPKSSDPVTALLTFQDNLVVMTRETKYILLGSDLGNFTQRQALGTKGCPSQEAVTTDNRNYVMFKADDQIYTFNGSTDTLLSEKVQPEVDDFTNDSSNTALLVYNNQLRAYYTPSGQAQNNKMLLYNMVYKEWFMDTDAYTTLPGVFSQDTTNPLVEASSIYGALFYGEVDFNNLGAPIDFKWWSAYKKYISAMSKDRIRRFHPEIRPSDTTFVMQIGKDINFQNSPLMQPYTVTSGGSLWGAATTIWGSFTWGNTQYQDTKVSLSGRGNHTQYRFERYGANTPVELYGYAALIRSSRLT